MMGAGDRWFCANNHVKTERIGWPAGAGLRCAPLPLNFNFGRFFRLTVGGWPKRCARVAFTIKADVMKNPNGLMTAAYLFVSLKEQVSCIGEIMKSVFKKLALAGVMAAAFATPALAAVSASATVSDFTITLYDLNPLDGIMPTITWSSVSSDPNMATHTSVNVSGPYGASNTYNYTPIGVVNTSTATISNGTATATINGNSMSASGSATATSAGWQNQSFSATAQNSNFYGSNFILSANTAVVFKANVTTQASATVGYDPVSGQSESASASVSMSVSGNGASGNGSQSSNDSLASSAGGYYWWYPAPQLTQSNSAILAGSFVNTSTGDLSGAFQLSAYVNGNTNVVASAVAAVPEPETYAMFLAGLGLLGAVARRRQAR